MAKKKLKVGFIGLGSRGRNLMKKLSRIDGASVSGLFDPKTECLDQAVKICDELGIKPKVYASTAEMLADPKIEAVIVSTSWAAHIPLACEVMEAGKAVATEVGPAMSLQECFKLVEVQERTGSPFMFLENICFGRDELMVMNMVKNGVFGEIVHTVGGYQHCVTDILYNEFKAYDPKVSGNERILNRMKRNMEPYPTHSLGPISKLLGINNGNRMVSLSAMSSKSVGLHSYVERVDGSEAASKIPRLAQGDVITTMIKCAGGETINLTWNTGLPIPVSNCYKVHGTVGAYCADLNSVHIDGLTPYDSDHPTTKKWESLENYREKYEHPAWKWFDEMGYEKKFSIKAGTHSSADYIELFAFTECVKNGCDMPVDVYDAASWMAVSVLVEQSLALGGQPVFVPDFTNGKWMRKKNLNCDEKWNCCL